MYNDTIAAVATALGHSGINIIRVSGKDAFSIVNKIYRNHNNEALIHFKCHTIRYGFIYDNYNNDEVLDEVMVSVFRAPKSYTMEDTVEINCHGGILITQKILQTLFRNGARPAEPGEFTKRAFLNGRIDLSKAEAVMDMIQAKNDFALKTSIKQLRGNLYEEIKKLRSDILYDIAYIESALDDPEHISLEGYSQELTLKINRLSERMQRILDQADHGRILKEGIQTVIVGKPNAGKSSLLNLLAGEEKAIVTRIPGTTRDSIEETIRIRDISLNIVDTAGIRETEDVVEKIGVDRAREFASEADLILYVVDSSLPLDDSDLEIMKLINNKKVIVLLNKTDLPSVISEDTIREFIKNKDGDYRIIKTSMTEKEGIQCLEDTIVQLFFSGRITMNDEVYITNLRQQQAMKDALNSLHMVRKSIEDDMPEDFLSIDLMGAYTSLGTIIGEETGEDLINEIFSNFCMGK